MPGTLSSALQILSHVVLGSYSNYCTLYKCKNGGAKKSLVPGVEFRLSDYVTTGHCYLSENKKG